MSLEIIFLGTGSAVPSKQRNHSSICVKGFGETFLFDCGEGTQRQMTGAKMSPMKVNNIFLTHLHGDHILGIPGLIQSLGFRAREDALNIFGPKGTEFMVNAALHMGYSNIGFPVNVYELEAGVILDTDEYCISCIETNHNITNLSYKIVEKKKPRFLREKAIALGVKPGPDFGRLHNGEEVIVDGRVVRPEQVLGEKRVGNSIVYSGDTRPSDDLVDFARGVDVLIHESTYQDVDCDKAVSTCHSTAREAAGVASRADVDVLILTHISTRYVNSRISKSEASEVFHNVLLSHDLLHVKVDSTGLKVIFPQKRLEAD